MQKNLCNRPLWYFLILLFYHKINKWNLSSLNLKFNFFSCSKKKSLIIFWLNIECKMIFNFLTNIYFFFFYSINNWNFKKNYVEFYKAWNLWVCLSLDMTLGWRWNINDFCLFYICHQFKQGWKNIIQVTYSKMFEFPCLVPC